ILVVCASSHPSTLSPPLGALAGGLGCFPLDNEAYPPLSHSPAQAGSIRSLVDFGNPGRPLGHPVLYRGQPTQEAAPQCISGRTSYLCVRLAFHQTTHNSSEPSSTDTGPGLHGLLPPLPPGHG